MIFPYGLDIHIYKRPFTNILLLFLMLAVFLSSFFPQYYSFVEKLILEDWEPLQMAGNVFVHADAYKLALNIIFLFAFGNAICSVIGNWFYPVIFLLIGVAGSAAHLYLESGAAVGASGIVSGFIAVILVWFPKSKVKFYYLFWFFTKVIHGSFKIRMIFVAILYFLADIFILGQFGYQPHYYVYTGGFTAGFILASLSQFFHLWPLGDETLFDLLKGEGGKTKVNDISELGSIEPDLDTIDLDHEELVTEPEPKVEEIITETEPEEKKVVEEKHDPVPRFRVLKIQEDHETIKCFIVNEGDAIRGVDISSTDMPDCKIEPSEKFRTNDAGIIKFTKGIDTPDLIRFFIEFGDEDKKKMSFALNRITGTIESTKEIPGEYESGV